MYLNFFGQVNEEREVFFKHSFGIQYNYASSNLYEFFWRSQMKRNVFAFRYGYIIHPNIKIGPEFSGFVMHFRDEFRLTELYYGGFARYTLLRFIVIKPFAELNVSYTNYFSWSNSNDEIIRVNESVGMAGYIAPGISFCMFKNRVNLDVMYKFSNKELLFLKNNMISFKLNYNFNFKK